MIKNDLYGTRIFRNLKTGSLCLVRIILDGKKDGDIYIFNDKIEYSTNGEEYKTIENIKDFAKKWKYLEIK